MQHWSQQRRLSVVLTLNLALIVGLVVAGRLSHSLGIGAAAGDTAADSVGLVLGLVAVMIRDRRGDDPQRSRATTVVALVNGAALLVVTVFIVMAGVRRLTGHGVPEVHGVPMVVASVVTCLVLLLGAFVLGRGAGSEDLHMRSVLLDTLADAASAAAVAIAGVVIAVTHGTFWLDPALGIVIGLVVAWAAVKLLRAGVRALRGEDVDFDDD